VQEYREHYGSLLEYKGNTFSMFIGLAPRILCPGGCLSYIVPNTLLMANTMQELRMFILKNFRVDELVNIRSRVFEEAEIGGNLVFHFSAGQPSREHRCALVDLDEIDRIGTAERSFVHQESFAAYSDFRFVAETPNAVLMRRLVSKAKPLAEIADFYNGIKTGDNKRFLAEKKLTSKHKPVIRGRDVHRYSVGDAHCFVLFDPEELWSNTNEEKLRKTPKIVVRQTGDRIVAALDEQGQLTLDTTHLIFDATIPIKALLGILNSCLINWYYQRLVEEVGRAFAEVKIVNLKKLPISSSAFDVTFGRKLGGLVDQILAAKRADAGADTSALEAEIDRHVYALYDLTPEEIKIVEESSR
jgi:hypothetical protein